VRGQTRRLEEWLRTLGVREATVIGMLVVGFIGLIGATGATNSTARSIWIGVASTGFASGLVDLSAVRLERRRAGAIARVAARRIGKVHQDALKLIQVVFPEIDGEAGTWPERLRSLRVGTVDLMGAAKVIPPMTRDQYAMTLVGQIQGQQLASFVAGTDLDDALDAIDIAISSSSFIMLVQALSTSGTPNTMSNGEELARLAAVFLERIQEHLPSARRAAGSSWKYGKLL